eukprot:3194352-Alexandrium_andersonii.AAC.1
MARERMSPERWRYRWRAQVSCCGRALSADRRGVSGLSSAIANATARDLARGTRTEPLAAQVRLQRLALDRAE